MSRSLSYLRRGLLGIAFVGSLGFGATQALAEPQASGPARAPVCYGAMPFRCMCNDGSWGCSVDNGTPCYCPGQPTP